MRTRPIPGLILAWTLILTLSASAQWQTISEGIDYQEYTLSGPRRVFVTRMDRANTSCIIDSCIAQGKLYSGRETVSGMANRYEDTIGYWGQTWGTRYDVVAAINGDGFSSDQPTNGQVISGWYAKRFNEFTSTGFVWTLNRTVFIGDYIYHPSNKNIISYQATGQTQNISGINRTRANDEIIIYTPQYGPSTYTDTTGSEVVVRMTRPLVIMPSPNYVQGFVQEVRSGQGNTPIPFDCVVLSAKGTATAKLLANSVGNEVRFSMELNHYETNPGDYTKTYSCIGYMTFVFLKDGVIQSSENPGYNILNPRTAVAYNDNSIFFVVVDGRSSASVGMTMPELGDFCLNQLGATFGINQDGGGSSALWVNGQIKNVPSDGSERSVTNGLMMIKTSPRELSSEYAADDPVLTSSSTPVRLGPGTGYGPIATAPSGQSGQIVDHAMNGVYAQGHYWWKWTTGSAVGWSAQDAFGSFVPSWESY
jgi:hypothetical protein